MAVLVSFVAMTFSVMASSQDQSVRENDTTERAEVFIDYEQQPQFPGGEAALLKYLQENVKYPPKAVKDSIQGRVVVQFIVDSLGYVGEVKVVRSVSEDLDAEAVRVVKTLPRFAPGRLLGKTVSMWYTLPVTFKLQDTLEPAKPKDVEVNAEFPGGEDALAQFLKDHIKYPPKAAKNRIQGRVEVEYEKFSKKVQIESRILGDIAINHIVPTAVAYQNRLIENLCGLKQLFDAKEYDVLSEDRKDLIREISSHVTAIKKLVKRMTEERHTANTAKSEHETAVVYDSVVRPTMEEIRSHIDDLELVIDDDFWPMPKYRELLFS